MKNDHRSKFSNLSDWKEEAWKNQGFNGIRTCDIRDTGGMLYQLRYEATHWEPWFFQAFSFQLLKLENLLRWSFFTFIYSYDRSWNMNYFMDTSHHFTPHGRYELNKLTSLSMCGFIAQLVEHHTGITEVTGSNPVEAFFQASSFQLLQLENLLQWSFFTLIFVPINFSGMFLN